MKTSVEIRPHQVNGLPAFFILYANAKKESVPLPNVMAKKHCSCCKAQVPQGDWKRFVIVLDSSARPQVILHAYLCDGCEEQRQRWIEAMHGLRRGDIVRYFNGMDTATKTIDYFFDESCFVGTDGYCHDIKGVQRSHIQSSLF